MTQHTSHEVCDREPKGFKIKNEILSRRRWHISGRNPPEDEGLGNRQGRVSGRLRIEFVSGLLNVHASSGGRSSLQSKPVLRSYVKMLFGEHLSLTSATLRNGDLLQ